MATAPDVLERPVTGTETTTDRPWIVLVWNDPINTMSYVVLVFRKLFGFSMEKLGLVPALVLLFFIAALAGSEFRFKEVLLLAVLMSAVAAAVFVYGLQLPYPLFGSY